MSKKPTPQLGDFVYDVEHNVYMIGVISTPFVKIVKVAPQKDMNMYKAYSEKITKLKYIRAGIWEIKL